MDFRSPLTRTAVPLSLKPIFFFSFDLPVLRSHGMFAFLHRVDGPLSCLKKFTRYTVLSSKRLRFLDVLNFTAGKTSLSNFLKSFGIGAEEGKDYFPYSALRSRADLDQPTLPSYEDFQDNMSGGNLLSKDWDRYRFLRDTHDLTEPEACRYMGLDEAPPTGPEMHAGLIRRWEADGVHNMRDLLVKYSRSDVEPLLKVLTTMLKTFQDHLEMDIFKQSVSVSSAVLPYALCSVRDQSVYNQIINMGPREIGLLEKSLHG